MKPGGSSPSAASIRKVIASIGSALAGANFVVLKAAIDRQVNAAVGHQSSERHAFTRAELDQVEQDFPDIVERAVQEVFCAAN